MGELETRRRARWWGPCTAGCTSRAGPAASALRGRGAWVALLELAAEERALAAAPGGAGGGDRPPVARRADRRPAAPRRARVSSTSWRATGSPGWRSRRSRSVATRTRSLRLPSGAGGTGWSPPATCGPPSVAGSTRRRRRRARRGAGRGWAVLRASPGRPRELGRGGAGHRAGDGVRRGGQGGPGLNPGSPSAARGVTTAGQGAPGQGGAAPRGKGSLPAGKAVN